MFWSLLFTFSISNEYSICFYDESDINCPLNIRNIKKISIINFSKEFIPSIFPNPNDFEIYIVGNMKNCILDFSSYINNKPDVSIYGLIPNLQVSLNINNLNNSLTSIRFENIEINLLSDSNDFEIETIHMLNSNFITTYPHLHLNVINFEADFFSLSSFTSILFNDGLISTEILSLKKNHSIYFLGNFDTKLSFRNFENNTEISLINNDILFSNNKEFRINFTNYHAQNIKIIHVKKDLILTLLSFGRGPHYFDPNLELIGGNNSIFNFPKSFWPENKEAALILTRLSDVTLIIEHFRLPLKISSISYPLKIIPKSVLSGLYGSISLESNELTIESHLIIPNQTFVIETIFANKNDIIIQSNNPNLEIFIRTLNTNEGLKHQFLGDSHYRLRTFPESISTLTFSNFFIRQPKPIELPFNLKHSTKIIVLNNTILGSDQTIIKPFFNDEIPSISEIENHLGSEYPILCSKNLKCNSFSINFQGKSPLRGFSSGTEIFKSECIDKELMKCLQIKMDIKISTVGYQFCLNPNNISKICPENYIEIITLEDFNTWTNYAKSNTEQFEFVIFDSIPNSILDFSKFTSERISISLLNRNETQKSITIDHKAFHSNIRSISLDSLHIQTTEGWDGLIESSLFLKEVTWEFKNINVASWVHINTDWDSYKSLPLLYPRELKINNIPHQFAIMNTSSLILKTENISEEINIPINNSIPKLFLTLANNLEITKLNEVTELTSIEIDSYGSHSVTIKGENWPDYYSGIIFDSFSGGSIISNNGKYPVEIVSSNEYIIESKSDFIEFIGPVNLDSPVNLLFDSLKPLVVFHQINFGKNTQLIISEKTTIRAIIASVMEINLNNQIPKLELMDYFSCEPNSYFKVKEFSFTENLRAVISISFRFDQIPYIELNRNYNDYSLPKFVSILHKTDEYDEEILLKNKNKLLNKEFSLICGKNLHCNNWELKSQNSLKFGLTLNVICKNLNDLENISCINILINYPNNNPTPKPTIFIPTLIPSNNKNILKFIIPFSILIVLILLFFLFKILNTNKISFLESAQEPLLFSDESLTRIQ